MLGHRDLALHLQFLAGEHGLYLLHGEVVPLGRLHALFLQRHHGDALVRFRDHRARFLLDQRLLDTGILPAAFGCGRFHLLQLFLVIVLGQQRVVRVDRQRLQHQPHHVIAAHRHAQDGVGEVAVHDVQQLLGLHLAHQQHRRAARLGLHVALDPVVGVELHIEIVGAADGGRGHVVVPILDHAAEHHVGRIEQHRHTAGRLGVLRAHLALRDQRHRHRFLDEPLRDQDDLGQHRLVHGDFVHLERYHVALARLPARRIADALPHLARRQLPGTVLRLDLLLVDHDLRRHGQRGVVLHHANGAIEHRLFVPHQPRHAYAAHDGRFRLLERADRVEAFHAVEQVILLDLEQFVAAEEDPHHAVLKHVGGRLERVSILGPARRAHHGGDLLDLQRAVILPHAEAVVQCAGIASLAVIAFHAVQFDQVGDVLPAAAPRLGGFFFQQAAHGIGQESQVARHLAQHLLVRQMALQRPLRFGHRLGVGVGEEVPRVYPAIGGGGISVAHDLEHVLGVIALLPAARAVVAHDRAFQHADTQLAEVVDHVAAAGGVVAFGQLIVDHPLHAVRPVVRFLQFALGVLLGLAQFRSEVGGLLCLLPQFRRGHALRVDRGVVLLHQLRRLFVGLFGSARRFLRVPGQFGHGRRVDAPILLVVGEQHIVQPRRPGVRLGARDVDEDRRARVLSVVGKRRVDVLLVLAVELAQILQPPLFKRPAALHRVPDLGVHVAQDGSQPAAILRIFLLDRCARLHQRAAGVVNLIGLHGHRQYPACLSAVAK